MQNGECCDINQNDDNLKIKLLFGQSASRLFFIQQSSLYQGLHQVLAKSMENTEEIWFGYSQI
jgi:hypothetical protein